MKNEDILRKSIEKAGWLDTGMPGDECKFKDYTFYDWQCLLEFGHSDIILSPDFANDFWGENTICSCVYEFGEVLQTPSKEYPRSCLSAIKGKELIPEWQYHLQQMVILPDDERLEYLEKFL